jgi:hypothetical protein
MIMITDILVMINDLWLMMLNAQWQLFIIVNDDLIPPWDTTGIYVFLIND